MRYRDNAGTTLRSEKAAEKHIRRLGNIAYVKGYVYKGKYGPRVGVLVRGVNGTARFNAFSWGYGGTGPNGLFRFLTNIGVNQTEAEKIAFNTPWNPSKIGEVWRIELQTPACAA